MPYPVFEPVRFNVAVTPLSDLSSLLFSEYYAIFRAINKKSPFFLKSF